MASLEKENLHFDHKKAVEELIKGRELATQLNCLLSEASGPSLSEPATGVLVEEVLRSFAKALSALGSGVTAEAGQSPTIDLIGSPRPDDRRSKNSKNSGEKRKIHPVGDRRGGYRRRGNSHSWTRVTSKTIDDGFTWRKYGQKEINNANFPRSYFRCTHKHALGCQATRQVQRSESDPSMFLISYMGEHTCKNATKELHLITASNHREPCLISFGSNTTNISEEPTFTSSFPSLKQECEEEVLSNLTHGSSTSEYLMLPDLATFDASVKNAGATSEHGDVTSGVHSSATSLDMDFMADSFEFDDVFSFDQDDFFQD